MTQIDHKTLKNLLHYNEETGIFIWSIARPKIKVGDQVGFVHHSGYIHTEIFGRHYALHRLAWFYVTGSWPKHQIDHINGNKADNRFANLREATNAQNSLNKPVRNSTGYKGVAFKKWLKKKPYTASITINGKITHLGCFATAEEAFEVYKAKSLELHKEFSLFNRDVDRAAC
jgi:hypothetical protein